MEGVLDFINKEMISGWVFGELKNLKLKIDSRFMLDLKVKSINRPDVENTYPNKQSTGFEIETPREVIDGSPHLIELFIGKNKLENSPKTFRYTDEKILFIHIPKTGGSSVVDSLRMHKSQNGSALISNLLLDPVKENYGFRKDGLFSQSFLKKIAKKIMKKK
jgi:hypothetical protein